MNFVLSSPAATFTDRDTQGGITLTRAVNSGENITLGSCTASQIEFEVLDLSGAAKHYAGTEFLLSSFGLAPYTFLDEQPLIFRDGDRYYFKTDEVILGYFIAQKPERINESRWKFICYDRMVKFDVIVDEWLAGFVYPITLKNMLVGLCAHCGVSLETASFTNQNFLVKENFSGQGITGRQVLSWIAEIAACFAHINAAGNLVLDWYKPTAKILEKTISNRVCDYQVAPIDKLQVKATENDIGVIVGTGTNAYVIQANPLLYASADTEIRPYAEAIFDKIKDLTYTPLEAESFGEYVNFAPGEIISVKTRLGEYATCVTEMVSNGIKTTVKSTGAENRNALQSVNSWIKRMNGKTNEIKASIDEFSVTLAEVKGETEQNSAQLLIQANQISQKVSQTDYNGNTISSLINQTATSILIQASKINLVGYVTTTNLETGNLTIRGKLTSQNGVEVVSLADGYLDFIYGGTLRGSIYTNANNRQNLCVSSRAGALLFAAGGYLRGEIQSDGTFNNKQYDIRTSGDVLVTGYYYADGYRGYDGTFKDADNKTVRVRKGVITSVG